MDVAVRLVEDEDMATSVLLSRSAFLPGSRRFQTHLLHAVLRMPSLVFDFAVARTRTWPRTSGS
eukprot:557528-Rhodomonas_salina.5